MVQRSSVRLWPTGVRVRVAGAHSFSNAPRLPRLDGMLPVSVFFCKSLQQTTCVQKATQIVYPAACAEALPVANHDGGGAWAKHEACATCLPMVAGMLCRQQHEAGGRTGS